MAFLGGESIWNRRNQDNSGQPNQNQYLQGNPSTNNNANTNWMMPEGTNWQGNSGGGWGNNAAQMQPNPPSQVSNGTMLGSLANGSSSMFGMNGGFNGNTGYTGFGSNWMMPHGGMQPGPTNGDNPVQSSGQYMPGDVNLDKWNDPNHTTPKYAVLRILSKYPPGAAGLQAAKPELLASGYVSDVNDKDGIVLGGQRAGEYSGRNIDVGRAFSTNDPKQMGWYWGDQTPEGGASANPSSMLGMNQMGNNPQMLQQLMQQLFSSQRKNKMSRFSRREAISGNRSQAGLV